jgi:hypothetical protein
MVQLHGFGFVIEREIELRKPRAGSGRSGPGVRRPVGLARLLAKCGECLHRAGTIERNAGRRRAKQDDRKTQRADGIVPSSGGMIHNGLTRLLSPPFA